MINQVRLLGRVGRDPEIRTLQSGSRMCNLSVATSEHWKDKHSGERKEKTQWHRVVIFNSNLIDKFIEPYIHKGDLVNVEGTLEYRTWQAQDGTDRTTAEIVIKQFNGNVMLIQRSGGSNNYRDDDKPGYTSNNSKSNNSKSSNFDEFGIDDDEIPF